MTYKTGAWNVVCDVCGFDFKSDEVRERWDGAYVCRKDFETRHPSDLLRVARESTSIPWSRPEPTDTFTTVDSILLTNTYDLILDENNDAIQG